MSSQTVASSPQRYLTRRQAQAYLQMCKQNFARLVHDKALRRIELLGRTHRYDRADLDVLMSRSKR